MHLPFCCRLHYRLRLLFVALAVFAGTPFQRSFAQDLTFPLSPLRWAQRSETPPAPASPQIGIETLAHTEQQTAVLNLIASNRADVEERGDALAKEKNDWEAKLQKLAAEGLAEPQPYSFLELDRARDELASETANARAQREAIAAAKEAVTLATTEVESKQRDVRRAKDGLEHNKDVSAEAALTQAIADAEHVSTVAAQTLELRRAELANVQLEQEVQSLHLSYAKRRLDLYQQDVVFTSAMLDTVLAELDARGKAATARAKQLGDDLSKFLQPQWYQARERLDDARVTQDQPKLPALAAEVQAKDLAQQLADHEIGINVTKLDRAGDLKTAWERRFEMANSMVSSSNTAQWLDETKAARERLRGDAATLEAKIDGIQRQLTSLEKKLQDADAADASLRYWLGKSRESLEQQRRLCEKALAELEPARRVLDKLLEDLTGGTLSGTAARWLAEARQDVRYVWDYELANVQDRSITVGRIVKGLFLFFIGIYASRWISRGIGRRLLTRMGVNASASDAFQSVAFYLLVLLFTLYALKLVEVPLTAFTVLGGAVALGVGFGSQNIVNNFISGLILLAERPVKVGDLIQLADIYGNVEHIGARSTRVRTGDNLDIIVPNSTFLETNVVNWTLSDNHMRTHVKFGVMYGSPTGKVTHLALKAAANHDRVFDRPAPFVIFADFGESALVFELHFWVAVRTLMERRTIESEIRFNIEHLFREAGIVIAYPQRDVHLFTQEPLTIEVTPPGQGNAVA